MNTIHPFDVRIEFADGSTFAGQVGAENSQYALRLALKAAEMQRGSGAFVSPVKTWTATALEFA